MSGSDAVEAPGEQRAAAALTASGMTYVITRHGPVASLAEAAAARGVQPGDIVKTLVVRRGEGDFLFVLVPGDREISWPKLRAYLGVNRLSMPDAATAREMTGYERGTITPFGSTSAWPVIADATLTAPVLGRILYRLSQPGEVLGGGGKVITLLDLSQVYMEMFLPADEAMRTGLGAEARIRLDSIPYAIPAYVSFVSPEAQFTPKQVETAEEREKLMFRVKVRLPEELVKAYIDQVKTGLRGVAYIRLAGAEDLPWPVEFVGEPIPADALPGN